MGELIEFGTSSPVHMKADRAATRRTDTTTFQKTSFFRVRQLAPQAALLTYGINLDDTSPICTLRSSCWQQRKGNWIMVFHQATITRDPSVNSDSCCMAGLTTADPISPSHSPS